MDSMPADLEGSPSSSQAAEVKRFPQEMKDNKHFCDIDDLKASDMSVPVKQGNEIYNWPSHGSTRNPAPKNKAAGSSINKSSSTSSLSPFEGFVRRSWNDSEPGKFQPLENHPVTDNQPSNDSIKSPSFKNDIVQNSINKCSSISNLSPVEGFLRKPWNESESEKCQPLVNHPAVRQWDTSPPRVDMRKSSSLNSRNQYKRADMEATETRIQELHEDATAWERRARKLQLEVETLKHKLNNELRQGSNWKMQLCAMNVECEALKSELAQLNMSKLSFEEKEVGYLHTRHEVDEAKRLVEALREEVLYEKNAKLNLASQLQKTQESYSELLGAVEELEENLHQGNLKAESLTQANNELQALVALKQQQHEVKDAFESEMKLPDGSSSPTATNQDTFENEMELPHGSSSPTATNQEEATFQLPTENNVKAMRDKMEELDRYSKELTEENVQLRCQLTAANQELEEKESIKCLYEQEVSEKKTFIDDLEAQMKVLRDKCQLLEDGLMQKNGSFREMDSWCAKDETMSTSTETVKQHQQAQNEMFRGSDDSNAVQDGKSQQVEHTESHREGAQAKDFSYTVEELEKMLQKQTSSSTKRITELEEHLSVVTKDNMVLKHLKEELESKLHTIDLEKESFEKQLQDLAEGHEVVVKELQEQIAILNNALTTTHCEVQELENIAEELNECKKQLQEIRSVVEELNATKKSLRELANESQSKIVLCRGSIESVQKELYCMTDENVTYKKQLQDHLSIISKQNSIIEKVNASQNEIQRQASDLQSQILVYKESMAELQRELEQASDEKSMYKNQVETSLNVRQELQSKIEELNASIEHLQGEVTRHKQMVAGLERKLQRQLDETYGTCKTLREEYVSGGDIEELETSSKDFQLQYIVKQEAMPEMDDMEQQVFHEYSMYRTLVGESTSSIHSQYHEEVEKLWKELICSMEETNLHRQARAKLAEELDELTSQVCSLTQSKRRLESLIADMHIAYSHQPQEILRANPSKLLEKDTSFVIELAQTDAAKTEQSRAHHRLELIQNVRENIEMQGRGVTKASRPRTEKERDKNNVASQLQILHEDNKQVQEELKNLKEYVAQLTTTSHTETEAKRSLDSMAGEFSGTKENLDMETSNLSEDNYRLLELILGLDEFILSMMHESYVDIEHGGHATKQESLVYLPAGRESPHHLMRHTALQVATAHCESIRANVKHHFHRLQEAMHENRQRCENLEG